MIHQPLGGSQGQATEIKIAAERLLKLREKLNVLLCKNTGQDLKIIEYYTETNHFLTSKDVLEYGLVDEVLN